MHDNIPEIRCPRLGHQVALAYCYRMAENRPCRRLFHCWEGVLPRLRTAVSRLLSAEEFQRYFETPPPPKLVTLVELAEKAKNKSQC
jgi:hypothetical protein